MDARSDAVAAKLVVAGPRGLRVVALGHHPVVLGRDPGPGGVVLAGRRVSRRHCRLEPVAGGGHRLVDLDSSDGMWVNRRRVATATLAPGDEVRLGEVVLVYLDPEADTDGLAELDRSRTRSIPTLAAEEEASHLEQHLALLERGLSAADPRSQEELQTILGECLAGLACAPGWRGAALVLLREPHGLESLATQGGAIELAPRRSDVLAALAEERIVVAPLPPGGPAERCWVVPMDHHRADRPWAGPSPPDEVRGALLLAGSGSVEPCPAVEALLAALVRRLALFVSSVRLRERANRDPLTELASRARIEQLLEHALSRGREVQGTVGVVLLDLDDFKRVNDLHGHAAGDRVLEAVAALVRGSLRRSDAAGRWGGDELLLVLPDADPEGAATAAAKVVEAMHRAGIDPPVTLSAGVACFPHHAGDVEGLLLAADQALYASKGAGKDQVRVHRTDEPPAQRPVGVPRAWLCSDLTGSFPLRTGSNTIGRGSTCDLVLPHPNVSRCHAIVTLSAEGWSVQDCSTNGVVLNGHPVVGSAVLHLEDRLAIGPYELRLLAAPGAERDTPPAAWVSSRIEVVNLGRFLSGLAEARCTGTLVVRSGEAVGSVNLREGRCQEAALGFLDGVEALQALALLEHGTVSFAGAQGAGRGELERILLLARRVSAAGSP